MIKVAFIIVALGSEPWCHVYPNTQEHCLAQDKKDCDGTPAKYCFWDSKEECEKYKLHDFERCEPIDG